MKPRILFQVLIVAAVALAACAPQPAAPAESASQPQAAAPTQEGQPAESSPATQPAAAESVPPVGFTPRGEQLEATDPATVSLASGGLQLVEFFRFT